MSRILVLINRFIEKELTPCESTQEVSQMLSIPYNKEPVGPTTYGLEPANSGRPYHRQPKHHKKPQILGTPLIHNAPQLRRSGKGVFERDKVADLEHRGSEI